MPERKKKILATLGPASMEPAIIRQLDEAGVDIFRINLSHTRIDSLENIINTIRSATVKPICLDTEGAQIRNASMADGQVILQKGNTLLLTDEGIEGDWERMTLRPNGIVQGLEEGDMLTVDFDSVLLKVLKKEGSSVIGLVMRGGSVGSNKAVTLNRPIHMPPLSEKDKKAIEIGLEMNVEFAALSFAHKKEDVEFLRQLSRGKMEIMSKIECSAGIKNLVGIISASDSIIIDRGDLSREEPFEIIPFLQKNIITEAKKQSVPVYVATNLLESMVSMRHPSRAEVNDVMNTLIDGADGLVLAAECAIGKFPVECAKMIGRLIDVYELWENTGNIEGISNSHFLCDMVHEEPEHLS